LAGTNRFGRETDRKVKFYEGKRKFDDFLDELLQNPDMEL
jgi:hypothetical protein